MDSDLHGFVTVTNAFLFTCALDGEGSVYCWGDSGGFGNDPRGPSTSTPTPAASGLTLASMEAGNFYACGIDDGSQMYCWGSGNESGERGDGSFVPAPTPTQVVGDLSFKSLDANNNNTVLGVTCGVTTDGVGHCWGSNFHIQLGGPSAETCSGVYPSYDCSSSPVEVASPVSLHSIDVGQNHTCALGSNGIVYCWGKNEEGQLGDGTVEDSPVPVPVPIPSPITAPQEVLAGG
jgi:alpha-tubulin suppressor-like RCC1 family protein